MGHNSWDAVLTVRGLVMDIDFFGDDDDEHYGKECLRRSNSEPNMQTSVHLPMAPVQTRITVNLCSQPLAETFFYGASSKRKDSEHDVSMVVLDQWTSEEDCFSQDSFKVEGVEVEEYNESAAFKDSDVDGTDGYGVAHEATAKRKRRKKQRPCKGQRIRHQKLEERLRSEINERPEVFDFDGLVLPPSYSEESDSTRREALVSRLKAYKDKVLREREIERILQPLLCDSYQTGDASMEYNTYSLMATRAKVSTSCSNMTQGRDSLMVPLC